MKSTEPILITSLVTNVLEKLDVSYVVVGSLASSLHGRGRSTFDADLVTDLRIEDIPAFVHHLSSDFFLDEILIQDAVKQRSSFNLIHRESAFKVDIFVATDRDFDQAQLTRRVGKRFDDVPGNIYFASPEDTVLAKLEWYRMGNEVSERQWTDIIDVLKAQSGALDMRMLTTWAQKLDITDLLTKALEEAGIHA